MKCKQCSGQTGHDTYVHDGEYFCSSECVENYKRAQENEQL